MYSLTNLITPLHLIHHTLKILLLILGMFKSLVCLLSYKLVLIFVFFSRIVGFFFFFFLSLTYNLMCIKITYMLFTYQWWFLHYHAFFWHSDHDLFCSGGWTISGTQLDLRDPRLLAIAEAERHFLEAEYDDYATSNASGAAFCRSVALIVSP
jgi:hypothetical protein